MNSDTQLVPLAEADMRSALTRPACDAVDHDKLLKRPATQQTLARQTADNDKASLEALTAEVERLQVLGERSTQRCDLLTREVERNREAYIADFGCANAKLEAATQQNAAMQASLGQAANQIVTLKAEITHLHAVVAALHNGAPTPAEAAAASPPTRKGSATGPRRTYAATTSPTNIQGTPVRSPPPASNGAPTAQSAEQERLRSVVIFHVRGCPIRATAAKTREQVGQVTTISEGARIRRLSRSREGDVEGPVLVTCRTPQEASELIRVLSTTEIDCGGLAARQDLSVEERAAKAARRCFNDQYVDLVITQGLRPQWRGPMRTELWVGTKTGDSWAWQRVLPEPPAAPAGPATGSPQLPKQQQQQQLTVVAE